MLQLVFISIFSLSLLFIVVNEIYIDLFGTKNKFLIDVYLLLNNSNAYFFSLLQRSKLSKKQIEFILKNGSTVNILNIIDYQEYRFEPKVVIDNTEFGANISNYFSNNKLPVEDYIEFLNYDISYYYLIKNPPKEVIDYYNLMTL